MRSCLCLQQLEYGKGLLQEAQGKQHNWATINLRYYGCDTVAAREHPAKTGALLSEANATVRSINNRDSQRRCVDARDALCVKAGEERSRGTKSSRVVQESCGRMSGGTNLLGLGQRWTAGPSRSSSSESF